MAKITYIEHTNKKHIVEVPNNMSVMEGAVQNNIPGIDADCGGSMACATCHVYIDKKWFDKLKKKDEGEEDMLDMAYQPNKFSRLSCQLIVSNELDGLILKNKVSLFFYVLLAINQSTAMTIAASTMLFSLIFFNI